MNPGEVIFWPGFEFPDGGSADKLFIVLNAQRNNTHLILKTTSRSHPKYRPAREGCHAKLGCYHIIANTHGFPRPTWVVLSDPIEVDASRLDESCLRSRVKIVANLKAELLSAIINCFKGCDDCTRSHVWLLS